MGWYDEWGGVFKDSHLLLLVCTFSICTVYAPERALHVPCILFEHRRRWHETKREKAGQKKEDAAHNSVVVRHVEKKKRKREEEGTERKD